MRPLRVLVASLSRDFGGVESLFLSICQKSDPDIIHFDFICTDKNAARENDFIRAGSKVYHLPGIRRNLKQYKKALQTLLASGNYDVFHVNMTRYMFPLDIMIAKEFKLKVFLHSHSTQIYKTGLLWADTLRKIEQFIFRPVALHYADGLIACSQNAGEYLFHRKKFTVLLNGIDIDKYHYSEENRFKIRNEFGIQNDMFLIGHIGRFSHEKNHRFLMQLFQKCYQDNPRYRLLCVGNGDLFEETKIYANSLGLADVVTFTGNRKDIAEILSALDLFVFPSIHEALPVTLIEAQANGLVCVASDCVTKEVDEKGSICYLSLQSCADKWADTIKMILRQNKNRTEMLDSSKSAFSVGRMIHNLIEIYHS